ncbi:MAG: DUF4492 domain-containing protein [Marinilabiliaceae bacterium]|nr:DUF4492 domain-containing protein [Marinilabiliaceae bacterium]
MRNIGKRIYNFYAEGFRTLSPYAKTLWLIILLKLFVMFFILKIFFFRDTYKNRFDGEKEISEHVINQITNTK